MLSTAETLEVRFARDPNALNFVRLCLASEVLIWHAYSLRGAEWLPTHVERFLSDIAVDAFFAISGFLICGAWLKRPHLGAFVAARGLRLLPGLWVCLLTTAFVVAPAALLVAGHPGPTLDGQIQYVLGNATTWVNVWGIDSGPTGVPFEGTWNGSLWSLSWETSCYAVVALLGVAGCLKRRAVVVLTASFWAMSVALAIIGLPSDSAWIVLLCRTGLMFGCGAMLWLFRDRVRFSRSLAAGALVLVVAAVTVTPHYRLLAAPAVAYLCLHLALVLGRHRRLVLSHDISYGIYVYAFPFQQALLVAGLATGWLAFAVLSAACVIPVAIGSWLFVERPAIRLRGRLHRVNRRDLPVVARSA